MIDTFKYLKKYNIDLFLSRKMEIIFQIESF